MKTCRACGAERPLEDFYVSTRRGGRVHRRATCRACWAEARGRPAPTRRQRPSRFNDQGEIRCAMCRQWLPREAFAGSSDPVPSYCLACRRIYLRTRWAAATRATDGASDPGEGS